MGEVDDIKRHIGYRAAVGLVACHLDGVLAQIETGEATLRKQLGHADGGTPCAASGIENVDPIHEAANNVQCNGGEDVPAGGDR